MYCALHLVCGQVVGLTHGLGITVHGVVSVSRDKLRPLSKIQEVARRLDLTHRGTLEGLVQDDLELFVEMERHRKQATALGLDTAPETEPEEGTSPMCWSGLACA